MSAPRDLLAAAHRGLTEAMLADTPAERYSWAHLAALRAAAAVLAVRARPTGRRSRSRSVWVLLPMVAPELREWAEFFAAGAAKRSLAQAGVPAVTAREADDLLRDAETFCTQVSHLLPISGQATLPATG